VGSCDLCLSPVVLLLCVHLIVLGIDMCHDPFSIVSCRSLIYIYISTYDYVIGLYEALSPSKG
jgi:hypothetical protein